MDLNLNSSIFLSGKEGLSDVYAEFSADDKQAYRVRMGEDCWWEEIDRFIAVTREGCPKFAEKLYVFKDVKRDRGEFCTGGDINIAYCQSSAKALAVDGGCYTTKPLFLVFTEKELTADSLSDFEKIYFEMS